MEQQKSSVHLSECADDEPIVKVVLQTELTEVAETVNSGSHIDMSEKFEVLGTIGEGGMSTVFKAVDRQSGELVAIKLLKRELARDPGVVERFYREGRAVQKLDHPGIVRVSSYGSTSSDGAECPYLVMEYIDGLNLAQIISAEGPLSPNRAVKLFIQISEALAQAHDRGIVHRDIKPSNVIVLKDDDGNERAKILDFGIARPSSLERGINPALTHTGTILGSPAYMSPEQCLGHGIDERSDLYSFGCLMYEVLTGRSPFAGETPVKTIIRHLECMPEPFALEFKHLKIPKSLEKIILKCLNKLPAERYQKAKQIKEALITPPPPGIWSRAMAELVDLVILVFASLILDGLIVRGVGLDPRGFEPIFFPILLLPFSVLYYSIMESSKLQATPGKFLFGLKVYDNSGGRIPFFRALYARSVTVYTLALLLCLVGWTLILAYGIPNHLNNVIVYMIHLPFCVFVLNFIPIVFNHGLQFTHDKIFGRFVAQTYVNPWTPPTKHVGFWKGMMYSGAALLPAVLLVVTMIIGIQTAFFGEDTVVIAKHEIEEGTIIKDDMLITGHTFKWLNAKNAIHDPKLIVGRIADQNIPTFDAVTDRNFEPANYQDVMNRTFKNQKHWRVKEIIDPYTGGPILVW